MSKSENAIRLNKQDVQALEADIGGNRFYPVNGYQGLCVQVTKAGVKSFVLRYRFHGRQKIHTLGVYPTMAPDEAKKSHSVAWTKINSGVDPNQERIDARLVAAEKKAAAFTVADLADLYIRDHIKVSNGKGWQAEATRLIKKHILPDLGDKPVKDVGPANISSLLLKIQKKTPTQANRVRAVLHTMFGRAEEWEKRPLGTNPVSVVKQRSPEVKRLRRLSELELKALGGVLNKSTESVYVLMAIRLALLAGMRKGEIQALRWEWLNLDLAHIRIPPEFHKTGKKTGKPRFVHLCSSLVTLLRTLPRTLGCIYVIPGLPKLDKNENIVKWGPFVGLQKPLERIREAAGFAVKDKPDEEDPGWHDLRRTFGGIGKDLGLKAFVGDLLGHSEQNVTEIYTRAAEKRVKEAAELIGGRIDGILTGHIDPERQSDQMKSLSEQALLNA